MTADVVDDLLKHDIDTNDLDLSDVKDYQTAHSMIKPTIDWHHYIKNYVYREQKAIRCSSVYFLYSRGLRERRLSS